MGKQFDNVGFGTRLNEILSQKQINQSAIAKSLGLGPSTISHYIHGQGQPNCETLVHLSKLLDVSLDYLLIGREAPVHALPPAQLDILVERAHSKLHREAAKHSAMTARIAQTLVAKIEEVAKDSAKEALPGPEFLESNFMVEIEECSHQIWLTTKGLKADDDQRIDVRFVRVVAENLLKGRIYRYILPQSQQPLTKIFRGSLENLCNGSGPVGAHLSFKFIEHSPVIGYGLHQVDTRALEAMPQFPFSRVQEWIYSFDDPNYEGYWLGHVMTPVPRAEFFTFMDKENVELALKTFHALWFPRKKGTRDKQKTQV